MLGFGQVYTAQNQVNVIIAQVQNISVTQPSVALQLTQVAHYLSGTSSAVQINHINVGSTTNYQVSVHAQQRFLTFNGGNSTIPVHTIVLQTTAGADLTGNGSPFSTATQITPAVALAETETVLISNAPPEGARGYNVTYAIPASNTAYYFNQPPGTYSTTVIYTLSAQ